MYSIGALARMLGVSPATLRSWEDRYGVVVPDAAPVRSGCTRAISWISSASCASRCSWDSARPTRIARSRIASASSTGSTSASTETSRASARFCSSSAIRTPRSSPSISCAPRATTFTSCVTTADAERLVAEQSRGLGDRRSHDRGRRRAATVPRTRRDRVACLPSPRSTNSDRALEAGAQAFIRKPFEPLALVSAARDLVGTSAIVRAANRVASD